VDARTAGTIRLPAEAGLDQNYPNPFNPTTTIRFALAEPARVRLTVLNVRGQQVAVLADGLYNAGPHTLQWDGRDATGRAAASGIYFCRLEAAGKVLSKKMTLIR
jgi:flagellar hook assembly protein FlgD